MEVINPIIMLPGGGGGGAPSAANICEMRMLPGDHKQNMPVDRYDTYVLTHGPLLHILRPGNYDLDNAGLRDELLQTYGVDRATIQRLYIAGNVNVTGSNDYMNFTGVYNRSQDAAYMECTYYVDNKLNKCALALVKGEQNCGGIPLTALYARYCDSGLLPLANLSRGWREYSTINLCYMFLEV